MKNICSPNPNLKTDGFFLLGGFLKLPLFPITYEGEINAKQRGVFPSLLGVTCCPCRFVVRGLGN